MNLGLILAELLAIQGLCLLSLIMKKHQKLLLSGLTETQTLQGVLQGRGKEVTRWLAFGLLLLSAILFVQQFDIGIGLTYFLGWLTLVGLVLSFLISYYSVLGLPIILLNTLLLLVSWVAFILQ